MGAAPVFGFLRAGRYSGPNLGAQASSGHP
jgi:hypothetical protein